MPETCSTEECDSLAGGLINYLERRWDVEDVEVLRKEAATEEELNDWQETHGCTLPDDLRNFYLTTNGITIRWSENNNTDDCVCMGRLSVNSLNKLTTLTVLSTSRFVDDSFCRRVFFESNNDTEGSAPDPRCSVFIIDEATDESYRICLVFNPKPEQGSSFWVLDHCLTWRHLCRTFTQFYLLSVRHLGLPHWCLWYTRAPIPSQSKILLKKYLSNQDNPSATTTSLKSSQSDNEGFDEKLVALSGFDSKKIMEGKQSKKKPEVEVSTAKVQTQAAAAAAETAAAAVRRKPPTGSLIRSNTGVKSTLQRNQKS